MELLQLRYFRAIVTYGSMSRAAQMLYVSQPTLSVTMTRLETSLGFPLFVRQKGKLSLTPVGEQFLTCVDRILNELDSTVSSLRSSSSLERSIRLVTSISDLVGAVMAKHYDDLQNLHISQRYCDNEQVSKTIMSGLADWGIVYGPTYAMQLHHTLLHQSPRVFALRDGHPLLRYERMPASELASQVYVCNRARDEWDTLTYCGKQYRFTPNIESDCDDGVLEMHILNSTDCISTMPMITYLKLRRLQTEKPLRFLFPEFQMPAAQTYVVRQNEKELSSYSMRLLAYIREFLAEEDEKLQRFLDTGIVEL